MAGDEDSSFHTVSAQEIQEVREQMRQLMQGMQQLQQAFQQQREEPPPHDNEDDDHHGGGRGRGFAAGFGRARRVLVGNPTDLDAETFPNYSAEHGGDHRWRHPERRHNDDGLSKVKVSIPPFSGNETSMHYFSCSGGTCTNSTKSAPRHVTPNLCFCIQWDLRVM
jgi:hypothetical protein